MILELSDRERIYADYHEKVMRYVRAKVANTSDIEDIISDVFLKVYGKLNLFDETKASLSTWIYHIAQNTVTDYYRKQRVFSDVPENLADSESIEDNLISEEMLEQLANGLEKLDERSKNLIVLHYYSGIKLKDFAEKSGISYVYAKVLHKKALEKLEKFLKQHYTF